MSNHAQSRRAILLARVSRGERGQDPENQLAPLRAAVHRLGWVIVKELPLVMWQVSSTAKNA